MNLEEIKNKIEEKGYNVVHRKDNNYSWLQCHKTTEEDSERKFITFNIISDLNGVYFRNGNKQISDNEEFKSINELIEHIDKL